MLGQSNPGDIEIAALGHFDIRTDCPRYCVFEYGAMTQEVSDIKDLWADDWVFFALGCSFSFEDSLIDAGIRLRHIE